MSLNLMPFDSLDAASPSVVTVTVSVIAHHPLAALTDNWTHDAASRHNIAPISRTRLLSVFIIHVGSEYARVYCGTVTI